MNICWIKQSFRFFTLSVYFTLARLRYFDASYCVHTCIFFYRILYFHVLMESMPESCTFEKATDHREANGNLDMSKSFRFKSPTFCPQHRHCQHSLVNPKLKSSAFNPIGSKFMLGYHVWSFTFHICHYINYHNVHALSNRL